MNALDRYIAAWIAADPERISDAVAKDCVVTECYGPVYYGRERVREWADKWFGDGGIIHRWDVTDRFEAEDRQVAQWVFECTWDGHRSSFEGATIARLFQGELVEIREYQTSAPLYEWTGTWLDETAEETAAN